MSFQIQCPSCGKRPVWEFHYGGPVLPRPSPDADAKQWMAYLYDRPNTRGVESEWWVHRLACKLWFIADRDTERNLVLSTRRYVPSGDARV